MNGLKRCPFCRFDLEDFTNGNVQGVLNETRYDNETRSYQVYYAIFCPVCKAMGGKADNEEEAIAAWNRRRGRKQCAK